MGDVELLGLVPRLSKPWQAIKLCRIGFQYLNLGGCADILAILQSLGGETLAITMGHVRSKHQLSLADEIEHLRQQNVLHFRAKINVALFDVIHR